MRFSSTLPLALAPAALARNAHNKFPVKRTGQLVGAGLGGVGGVGLGGVGIGGGNVAFTETQVAIVWVNAGGPAGVTQTINPQVVVTNTVAVPAGGAPSIIPGVDGIATTINPGQTAVIPGAATTHSVTVGGPPSNQFIPGEIKANVGDVVMFMFMAQNHTVTQSTFEAPCDILAGGMDSGYMANPNNSVSPPPTVAMQVMTNEPLWMFCQQGNHCGQGMVFSINANSQRTHAEFQSLAIAQRGQNLAQTNIVGGAGAAPVAPGAPPVAPAAPPADPAAQSIAPLGADPNAFSAGLAPTLASVGGVSPLATGSPINAALGGSVVTGVGTMQPDGSCACSVQCSAQQNFPDPSQGQGAFGGIAGMISGAQAQAGVQAAGVGVGVGGAGVGVGTQSVPPAVVAPAPAGR